MAIKWLFYLNSDTTHIFLAQIFRPFPLFGLFGQNDVIDVDWLCLHWRKSTNCAQCCTPKATRQIDGIENSLLCQKWWLMMNLRLSFNFISLEHGKQTNGKVLYCAGPKRCPQSIHWRKRLIKNEIQFSSIIQSKSININANWLHALANAYALGRRWSSGPRPENKTEQQQHNYDKMINTLRAHLHHHRGGARETRQYLQLNSREFVPRVNWILNENQFPCVGRPHSPNSSSTFFVLLEVDDDDGMMGDGRWCFVHTKSCAFN